MPALGVTVLVLSVNVALHVLFAFITVVKEPAVPEQAPLQPANVDPVLATAESVTEAFWLKLAVHVVPQLIPAGAEVTVPVPEPSLETPSEKLVELNVAMTVQGAVIGFVV